MSVNRFKEDGLYESEDGSPGITQTINIEDPLGTIHTLVFKNGLLTSYTTS